MCSEPVGRSPVSIRNFSGCAAISASSSALRAAEARKESVTPTVYGRPTWRLPRAPGEGASRLQDGMGNLLRRSGWRSSLPEPRSIYFIPDEGFTLPHTASRYLSRRWGYPIGALLLSVVLGGVVPPAIADPAPTPV